MFSRVYVENFRSYREFELDLLESSNPKKVKKALFIYGENGSGKSNLVEVFSFLTDSTRTLRNNKRFLKAMVQIQKEESDKMMIDDVKEFLLSHPILRRSNLSTLVEDVKALGPNKENENMVINFGFVLSGSDAEGEYTMVFNDEGELIHESLEYIIEKNVGTLFSIENVDNEIKTKFSGKFFNGSKKFKEELEYDIEAYWGKNTLLSIIVNMLSIKNSKIVYKSLNSNFTSVLKFFRSISVIHKSSDTEISNLSVKLKIFSNLDKGSIKRDNQKMLLELNSIEKILSDFFTSLYSDILKVEYDIKIDDNEIEYELCVRKKIGGIETLIPFSKESQGTKNLLSIFPALIAFMDGKVVIIDEIDTGIHDKLMERIMSGLLYYSSGQFIATTHNTQLLENLSADKVGIIAVDSYGNKKMNLLKNSDVKANNNLYKKYMKGDFYGIPDIFDIDFLSLVDDLNRLLESKPDLDEKETDQ
ncbi:AAA family ATPase [Exiguobacterium sp. R-39]|uniref:AAA family ATPase n=1 Tax=Exiguobacterium sp. R-39 TaxID=3416708 RepID=UPI003CEB544D